MPTTMMLSDRKAFVTGGGAGIGRGVCIALAAEGATVCVADRDRPSADAVAAEITAAGGRAIASTCDVADRDSVFAAIDGFGADAGGVDLLVNNAVRFHYAPLAEMPIEEIHLMIDVGIKGTLWGFQAATPWLRRAGGGCIVSLSSVAVSFGIGRAAVYTSIKGAVDALTRQQAVELGEYGIRVNAIAPGPIATPGASSVIDAAGWESRRARTPLRRLATPEDIGAAVVYLASDAGRTITGVTLKIDGGITVAGP